jgi:hypothetical protein
MTTQHEPTFEAQEQILPDRLDGFEAPSVEPFRDAFRRSTGMWSLDLDALADERLQPSGCAAQRVTFGHLAAQGSE